MTYQYLGSSITWSLKCVSDLTTNIAIVSVSGLKLDSNFADGGSYGAVKSTKCFVLGSSFADGGLYEGPVKST